MSKKYKIILISGGFDPLHKGHIQCIKNAKKLSDQVWIGLNSNNWLRNKKGKAFMKGGERKYIMENLRDVDYVYIMNPRRYNDLTACDFIEHAVSQYKNKYGRFEEGVMAFGNGGDRIEGTAPSIEEDVCKGFGIDLVWGLGDKIQSSSWLLEKYLNIAR